MKEIHDFSVLERRQLGDRYFALVLGHGGRMQPVMPGQFVEVLVEGERKVMLRRPISVHDVDEEAGTMTLLVQIVGNGTRRLAELKEGDRLNLVYPLGHGFTTDLTPHTSALLVGGGAGIAPLLHLSKVLKAKDVDCTILLGGRTAELIPVRDEFAPYGCVCIATDDGSLGHKGLVVEHPAFSEPYDMIYTCGPTPMMKAVARSAAERGIRCEVSLENMMACGVGACLCCVTDTDEGHRCVCKDGPVFDIETMKKWYEN
ncbi:MAG: dihydroorotate dehydrogenase electron transfer subunit [bacterium]